jgi:hypothetical protein
MNTFLENQPIRGLYICDAIIKISVKGTVKILAAAFKLADHEFI